MSSGAVRGGGLRRTTMVAVVLLLAAVTGLALPCRRCACDDLGLANHQFEAFAAHHLDQNETAIAAAQTLNESCCRFLPMRSETLVSSSLSSAGAG